MQPGDQICVFRSDEDPVTSDVALMIFALLTFKARPYGRRPYVRTIEMIEGKAVTRFQWTLHALTEDGVAVKKLQALWHDKTLELAQPEHPMCYVRVALRNMAKLQGEIAAFSPLAIVRKSAKRFARIPLNATPERRKQLLERLEKGPA